VTQDDRSSVGCHNVLAGFTSEDCWQRLWRLRAREFPHIASSFTNSAHHLQKQILIETAITTRVRIWRNQCLNKHTYLFHRTEVCAHTEQTAAASTVNK